jgi:hypothetical protein
MKPPPEAVPASAAVKPAAKPTPRVETPVVVAKAEPAPAAKAEAPAKAPKAEAAPTPRKKPVAKPQPATQVAAARPETSAAATVPAPSTVVGAGVIQLNILPWGEVFVDGRSRGVSPPLRTIELPPGPHTVEVRNTSFPTLTQRVDVRASEPVRIRHRFR